MSAFKLFKKEKKKEASVQEEKIEKPSEKKEPVVKKTKTGISKSAWKNIVYPHITEKASVSEEKGQYIFKVFPRTNKVSVKKAIEEIYGVEVENVNMITIPRKKRRRGRVEGWKKGYKKAIVKLKKGHKIEILPR